jgi:hypothetical protein
MPSSVEYVLLTHWHVQNGVGTGPPVLTQNGAGTGPPEAAVAQPDVPPVVPDGELPLATLLLVVAVLATNRWRTRRRRLVPISPR